MLFVPYIEIGAFVFLLMVTVVFFIKENLYTIQGIFYAIFLSLMLLTLALDIAIAYTTSYVQLLPLWANKLLNSASLFMYAVLSIIFLLYTLILSDNLHLIRCGKNRLILFLLMLPAVAFSSLLFFKTELVFYFDDGLRYTQGPLFGLLFVCAALYILLGAVIIIKNKKKLTPVQFYTVLLFIILLAASLVLQYHLPSLLITGAVIALGLTCMFFTYQNPDAYVDELTKLLGRSGFLVIVGQIIRWQKKPKSIVIIDINSFKTINNLFGIAVGDGLLLSIVNYLRRVAPNKRRIFRIGGDQFALIADSADTTELVEQIRRRFKYSWNVSDNRLHLSVSMARIATDQCEFTSEDLMRLIQNTLFLMKESGRGGYIEVNNEIINSIKRRTAIENSLRSFEQNGCLELSFQPIYSVQKKRITSAEVLLRMEHEELGPIPADEFIRIAEMSGLIARISRFVLVDTCRFISENRLWKYGLDMIDLNLSPAECLQEDYANKLKYIISSYPFDKHILSFEITETAAATSTGQILEIMETLSAIGVSFALDDYSQGYANPDTLIRFPFNAVKLDKDLLWSTFRSEKAKIVYRNTVKMIKELGMRIIAEGAETAEHIEMLHELEVDFIQGFYYGRPLDKSGFLDVISGGNAGRLNTKVWN